MVPGASQHDLVHCVIVIKLHEPEAPLPPGALVCHVLHVEAVPELAKVVLDGVILQSILDSANEDLLDGLGAGVLPGGLIPWDSPLGLHLLAINGVRTSCLHRVHHALGAVGDKAESPGALGLVELHHDAVGDLTELGEVLPQAVVGGVVVEAADEELPAGLFPPPVVPSAPATSHATTSTAHHASSASPAGGGRLLGSGPLGVHRLAVHHVGLVSEADVGLVRVGKGDKAEPPGALGAGEAHDHGVDELAVLSVEGLQTLLGGLLAQPAQEQLTTLIRHGAVLAKLAPPCYSSVKLKLLSLLMFTYRYVRRPIPPRLGRPEYLPIRRLWVRIFSRH